MCVCECILGAVCHFFMTPNRLDCRNFLLFIFPPPKLDWLFFFSLFIPSCNFHLLCVCVTRWVCRENCGKEHFKSYTNTHSLREWHCSRKICFSNSNKTEINTPWEGDSNGRSSRRWTTMTVAKKCAADSFLCSYVLASKFTLDPFWRWKLGSYQRGHWISSFQFCTKVISVSIGKLRRWSLDRTDWRKFVFEQAT